MDTRLAVHGLQSAVWEQRTPMNVNEHIKVPRKDVHVHAVLQTEYIFFLDRFVYNCKHTIIYVQYNCL